MHSTDFTTQADLELRTVSLANLLAICDRQSGVTHRYEVDRTSRDRLALIYSNPDEYGAEVPIYCYLPLIPNPFEAANPWVVLHVVTLRGGRDKDDREGACQTVSDVVFTCEKLYRTKAKADDWRTEVEIRKDLLQTYAEQGCIWCAKAVDFPSTHSTARQQDEHFRVHHVPGGGSTSHAFIERNK
jgi:hypothetical protein